MTTQELSLESIKCRRKVEDPKGEFTASQKAIFFGIWELSHHRKPSSLHWFEKLTEVERNILFRIGW
jgi:hypothetical protein